MRSMAILTTTRHGAVRVILSYSVPSDRILCLRVLVQSTSHAYGEYPRHRVNPRQEVHPPSDKPPKTANCVTYCIDRDAIRGHLSHGRDSLNFDWTAEERAIVEMDSTRHVCELRSLYQTINVQSR